MSKALDSPGRKVCDDLDNLLNMLSSSSGKTPDTKHNGERSSSSSTPNSHHYYHGYDNDAVRPFSPIASPPSVIQEIDSSLKDFLNPLSLSNSPSKFSFQLDPNVLSASASLSNLSINNNNSYEDNTSNSTTTTTHKNNAYKDDEDVVDEYLDASFVESFAHLKNNNSSHDKNSPIKVVDSDSAIVSSNSNTIVYNNKSLSLPKQDEVEFNDSFEDSPCKDTHSLSVASPVLSTNDSKKVFTSELPKCVSSMKTR